jgi:pterin-4a-carbinolamine dehydratase
LSDCSVLIAVIGPKWLHTHDQDGRRRIDNDTDWVRNEVLHALTSHVTVLPIFVQQASPFAAEALPEALRPLSDIQRYALSDDYWDRDFEYLVAALDRLGFRSNADAQKTVWPPPLDTSMPLPDDEYGDIEAAGWALIESKKLIHDVTTDVKELCKTYRFRSFEDCIHFMMTASRHISTIDHHPTWENVWVNLSVRLCTWDIGAIPSFKDVRLAKYLDELFIAYKKESEA